MARAQCHLVRPNRCLYLLYEDHKCVGEQEVHLMMSRQLLYSFSYLTFVTTGTSNLRLKWHQARIHGAHFRPCHLAQPQTSAGFECPQKQKTRLLASPGSSNFNLGPSSLPPCLRHMPPPPPTQKNILTSSVGSYAPTLFSRLDTAMLEFHFTTQDSISSLGTSHS